MVQVVLPRLLSYKPGKYQAWMPEKTVMTFNRNRADLGSRFGEI